MKKVTLLIAIMLISVSAFAVDFSASTYMTGSLWGTNGFVLNNQGQKDSDLLTVSVSDEMWGSSFRLYTSAANDTNVQARKIAIWVKPLPVLKVTVGSVESGLYKEQLDWWQIPTAAAAVGWDGDAATAGTGVNVELTAVENLWILAGIAPGTNAFMVNNANVLEVGANTKFGAAAKYTIPGLGSIGAAYRNNGGTTAANVVTWNDMSFRVGFDINAVAGLYAFIQGIFRIDTGATSISGIAIDNYVAYTAGDFYVKAVCPFTVRLVAGDSNYLTFDVKTGYTVIPNLTPFLRVTNETMINLTTPQLNPSVQLGADYSLGKVTFMTAVQIDYAAATSTTTWSIPFKMRASW